MIEPALKRSEANYIERLIALYIDSAQAQPNSAVSQSPEIDSPNDIVYTLNEIQSNQLTQLTLDGKDVVKDSIWIEAPGNLNN